MDNQEVLIALAQAIQSIAAKQAVAEAVLQSLIATQPAEQREQFVATFLQSTEGLMVSGDGQPLTGATLAQVTLAVNAYLETAGSKPLAPRN
ncbi:hypothetical protein CEG14_17345 [Bordetella genomosp. 1]|uniref:Uncharacterized protein n=1 Tax=Bordetella genomosp. 1 TaxID=1395607 RepID=A0A261S8C0_9BORD|nr:hypothetical protein [Bordetella genomosp. 1]MDQ8034206.1 hypothetical protein [Bordetella sp.]OZI32673.1 hypothetical protein CEG14_17345 [Bordetella genomosp. 1]OZI65972.1 hypothetical protein CAL27_13380 [Bordetella genomosp. 1]